MRDWRKALQSGTMRNVVAAMLLLDAAGLYLAQRGSGAAVDDEPLPGDAAAVAVNGAGDWLPAPLPRPQATVRVEFSDIPAAVQAPASLPAMPPALVSQEFRPEPLELASDEDMQPVVREPARRPLQMAVLLPAPKAPRSTTAFATAFASSDGQGADTRAADTQRAGAPSIAVDQSVYREPSPGTIAGYPVYDEPAPAVVDGTRREAGPSVDRPADSDARAGEVAAGSSDTAPRDTANAPEPRAELPA